MGADLSTARTCRHCAAAVRPGAPWCTQCFQPQTDPAQSEPGPEIQTDPGAEPTGADPTGAAQWPCTSCDARNPLTEDTCTQCGQRFLAPVSQGAQPLLVLPYVGDLAALRPAQRIGLAAAAVLVVLLVVLLLGALPI